MEKSPSMLRMSYCFSVVAVVSALKFLQETNQIFYFIDNINHRINAAKQKQTHIIELAISPNIDEYLMAELLRIYQEYYPQTQLNIHE